MARVPGARPDSGFFPGASGGSKWKTSRPALRSLFGSGISINTVLPEDGARFLRELETG
jgi:hypothetical protein